MSRKGQSEIGVPAETPQLRDFLTHLSKGQCMNPFAKTLTFDIEEELDREIACHECGASFLDERGLCFDFKVVHHVFHPEAYILHDPTVRRACHFKGVGYHGGGQSLRVLLVGSVCSTRSKKLHLSSPGVIMSVLSSSVRRAASSSHFDDSDMLSQFSQTHGKQFRTILFPIPHSFNRLATWSCYRICAIELGGRTRLHIQGGVVCSQRFAWMWQHRQSTEDSTIFLPAHGHALCQIRGARVPHQGRVLATSSLKDAAFRHKGGVVRADALKTLWG